MMTPENSKHNTNIYAHTGEKPKRENKKKRQIEAGKAGLQDWGAMTLTSAAV